MYADLILVIGITITAFSIPSVVANWSDRRPLRGPLAILLVGMAFVVWAGQSNGWRYQFADVPMAFLNVIARVLH